MTNLPAFFTSAVPTSARVAKALFATAFLTSHAVAMASAKAPLVMTLPFIPM